MRLEPAQTMNDLAGIKKNTETAWYWKAAGIPRPCRLAGHPEEVVRAEVRKCIDNFAPGGGFVFWASTYGAPDDEAIKNKARWIAEEYDSYGRNFYKK